MKTVLKTRRTVAALRKSARCTLAVALFFAVGILGTTLVTANGENDRAQLADEATAARVLGRAVPTIHETSLSISRVGIGIDPASLGDRRAIHVSYGVGGAPVILLTISRGAVESV